MDFFAYRDGQLHCEEAPVRAIVAAVGTPVYIYSKHAFLARYREVAEAFAPADPLVCYSVKSCGNLGVLAVLARAGAGFDVVSGGELFRVQQAGGDAGRVVFAGVGKSDEEIVQALRAGILMFNVESEPELENINALALREGKTAPVALRLNPDVDPRTHPYLATGKKENKFGLDLERAVKLAGRLGDLSGVRLKGVHMHLGSQITAVAPYAQALAQLAWFAVRMHADGHPVEYLNCGGGFGIDYGRKPAPGAEAYAKAILPLLATTGCRLLLEPGRYLSGNSGILVTRVRYVKDGSPKRFVIVDAGMNDLMRPSLYGATHAIWPLEAEDLPPEFGGRPPAAAPADIVGPVCESGDVFLQDYPLPAVSRGDLLAIFSAGAYGHVMSSRYNARPLLPEVVVSGEKFFLTRRRESYEDLVGAECLPEGLL